MGSPLQYRNALFQSPSPSPSRSSSATTPSSSRTRSRSSSAIQSDIEPTTSLSTAREPHISSSDVDELRLSSLCHDIHVAACETRGSNADIQKACQWLLNREPVPPALRAAVWAQLLRGDMSDVPEKEGSVVWPDRMKVEVHGGKKRAVETVDEEAERGRRRIRDAVPVRVEREALSHERRKEVHEIVQTNSIEALRVDGVAASSESSVKLADAMVLDEKEQYRAVSHTAGDETGQAGRGRRTSKYGTVLAQATKDEVEKKAKLQRENAVLEERMTDLLASQKATTEESLLALQRLGLEGPTVEAMCTCNVKCHCIYEGDDGKQNSMAAAITGRTGTAGLPPTSDEQFDVMRDTYGRARLDVGWYDVKPVMMPEGKRDSIRPDEDMRPGKLVSGSPDKSTDMRASLGGSREGERADPAEAGNGARKSPQIWQSLMGLVKARSW